MLKSTVMSSIKIKFLFKWIFIVQLLPIFVSAQSQMDQHNPKRDTVIRDPDANQYPVMPYSVEGDLNNSFPPPNGSLSGRTLVPSKYFDWKTKLQEKTGLKLAFSYAAMALGIPQSQVIADSSINSAIGGMMQIEAQWHFNRGKDYEGGITAVLDWRHALGSNNRMPGTLFRESGSGIGLDGAFLPWDPYTSVLYWQQHLKKDRFWFRIGQTSPNLMMDFFRYRDPRVSFTSTVNTNPLASIPLHPSSLGIGFNWYPIKGSKDLYVAGVLNDLNVEIGKMDWSSLFRYGEFYTALEIGKNWRRSPGNFDHLHVMFFYADKKSTAGVKVNNQFIPFPTSAGWGFKVAGEKQWNKLVAFANYTYNTATGGGLNIFTGMQHSITAGMGYNRPANIRGEIGFMVNLSSLQEARRNMINNPQNPSEVLLSRVVSVARDVPQFSSEIYWRILIMKQLWVTPGVQAFVNPTFNTRTDFIVAPSIKARIYF
jgi:hypothetical protein